MKRIIAAFAALACLFILTSCGSSNPPLNNVPPDARPAVDTAVVITRALARVEIAKFMRSHGASDATVTSTLDMLHKSVDELLGGRSIVEVVTDPAAWLQLRAIGVKQLASIISTAVPEIDQATAELLVGQVFDAAKAYVLQRLGPGVNPSPGSGGASLTRAVPGTSQHLGATTQYDPLANRLQVIGPVSASWAWCQQDDECRISKHQDAALAEAYCGDIGSVNYSAQCAARYRLARIKLRAVAAEVRSARLVNWSRSGWLSEIETQDAWLRTIQQKVLTDGK